MELISQLNVMGRLDEFGGRSGFFQRYCLGQENGAARLDELGRVLRTRCLLRRPRLDPATMPRQYHRVRIDNREDYNSTEVAASKDDDWVGWHTAPRLELAWGKFDAALAWIRAFLKDKPDKLVVFAYHREIVGDIAGAFQAPWITGETTKHKRAKAIERFTNDPACRLIVISIRADSRGWNLAPARQALFVELGFTPADQQRAEGLLAQPAQAHYLIATNTLEECFFDRIGDKQYVIRTVLDTLREEGEDVGDAANRADRDQQQPARGKPDPLPPPHVREGKADHRHACGRDGGGGAGDRAGARPP